MLNDLNHVSTDIDKETLMRCMKNCSDSMVRISSERDFMKEEIKAVSEKLKIDKALINRMIKVYHKQNFDEETKTDEEFRVLYEKITNE